MAELTSELIVEKDIILLMTPVSCGMTATTANTRVLEFHGQVHGDGACAAAPLIWHHAVDRGGLFRAGGHSQTAQAVEQSIQLPAARLR